jgi:hypothetical protein
MPGEKNEATVDPAEKQNTRKRIAMFIHLNLFNPRPGASLRYIMPSRR